MALLTVIPPEISTSLLFTAPPSLFVSKRGLVPAAAVFCSRNTPSLTMTSPVIRLAAFNVRMPVPVLVNPLAGLASLMMELIVRVRSAGVAALFWPTKNWPSGIPNRTPIVTGAAPALTFARVKFPSALTRTRVLEMPFTVAPFSCRMPEVAVEELPMTAVAVLVLFQSMAPRSSCPPSVLKLIPILVAALAGAADARSLLAPSPLTVAVPLPGKPAVEVQLVGVSHAPPVAPVHSWSEAFTLTGQAAKSGANNWQKRAGK